MKRLTIYDIKYRTLETSLYFFERKTLKFFGQTMKSFRVVKMSDGRYRISAAMPVGETVRFFNPENNKLERER